jgi:hypothetical protein
VEYEYNGDPNKLLESLAGSTNATKQDQWFSVVAAPMTAQSQQRLMARYLDPADPLGGFLCIRLADELCRKAFGLELHSAAMLSVYLLSLWFPFSSWCLGKGVRAGELPVHELFPAVYEWQLSMVLNQPNRKVKEIRADVAKLNRRIFGTNKPW